jgi:hypothetical protein
MKKLTLLIAILVSLSFVASAQLNFGVKAGLNMATYSGDADNVQMKPSYQIGGVVNFDVGSGLTVQPGLILSGKGAKSSENSDVSVNTNYLEVPVNIVYNISGFQVLAGPYLGYGLFGKMKGPDSDVDIKFKSDVSAEDYMQNEIYYNSIDYGVNVGAGYVINESIQVQAMYSLGLANINPKVDGEDPTSDTQNSVIQLTVAYFL